jgi:hypothetical protein
MVPSTSLLEWLRPPYELAKANGHLKEVLWGFLQNMWV